MGKSFLWGKSFKIKCSPPPPLKKPLIPLYIFLCFGSWNSVLSFVTVLVLFLSEYFYVMLQVAMLKCYVKEENKIIVSLKILRIT